MYFYNRDNFNNREDYENLKNYSNYDERKNCCIRKVEETYLCFPSYYNEEKDDCTKDDIKENYSYPCFEGTFTMCPRKSHCGSKRGNTDYKEKSCGKEYNNNHHNKWCFCNLFNCHRW